jgi:hypothetical protein
MKDAIIAQWDCHTSKTPTDLKQLDTVAKLSRMTEKESPHDGCDFEAYK